MSGLVWKLRRLQVMGPREIAYRIFRTTSQAMESVWVKRGGRPHLTSPVKPGCALFPALTEINVNWQSRYHLDTQGLEALLQNQVALFGTTRYSFSFPQDWHRSPDGSLVLPHKFGKAINYRDDRVAGNVKLLWEIGRHHHLLPVAVAYTITGEQRYRDHISETLAHWIIANPYGMGIHWCSALEVALRLIAWALVHGLIAVRDGSDGLFGAVCDRPSFERAVFEHAWFIRHFLSRYSSANNHLIGELTGLWVGSVVFDLGASGFVWEKFARKSLEREFHLQVFSDGVSKEQAFYYHLWVLEYALLLIALGKRVGRSFSQEFEQRARAMVDFLRAVTPGGGVPPQVGDSDDGFVTRFEPSWPTDPFGEVLAACQWVFDGSGSVRAPQKAFWYAALAGTHNTVSSTAGVAELHSYPRVFMNGGYVVLGDAWVHLVFDAGSLGYPAIAAHGHADALGFCLALDSVWWFVDPGTYAYHSEPEWRDYFRSTAAHNTVEIDGKSQSVMGGPFLWLKHASARIVEANAQADRQWVVGEHNGYRKFGVTHRRRIEYVLGSRNILVTDNLEGYGEHEVSVSFHFAPEVSATEVRGDHTIELRHALSHRIIRMHLDPSMMWQTFRGCVAPRCGWYSPHLGEKQPAVTLRGEVKGLLRQVNTEIYIV